MPLGSSAWHNTQSRGPKSLSVVSDLLAHNVAHSTVMALKLLLFVSFFLASAHASAGCYQWQTFGPLDINSGTELANNGWATDCNPSNIQTIPGEESLYFFSNELEPLSACFIETTLPPGGDFVRVVYGSATKFSSGITQLEVGGTVVASASVAHVTTDAPYNDGDTIKLTELDHVAAIIYSIDICNYIQPNAGSCFHGDGTVLLESGLSKRLSELSLGERIETCDGRGAFAFNPVLILPHENNTEPAVFLTLTTETGKMVDMTPDHFIPRCDHEEVTAGELYVGDCIFTIDGKETLIEISKKEKTGVFTAVTQDDFIVVDGIVASPYSKIFDPRKKYLSESSFGRKRKLVE